MASSERACRFRGKTGEVSNGCLLQALLEKVEGISVLASDIKSSSWPVTSLIIMFIHSLQTIFSVT